MRLNNPLFLATVFAALGTSACKTTSKSGSTSSAKSDSTHLTCGVTSGDAVPGANTTVIEVPRDLEDQPPALEGDKENPPIYIFSTSANASSTKPNAKHFNPSLPTVVFFTPKFIPDTRNTRMGIEEFNSDLGRIYGTNKMPFANGGYNLVVPEMNLYYTDNGDKLAWNLTRDVDAIWDPEKKKDDNDVGKDILGPRMSAPKYHARVFNQGDKTRPHAAVFNGYTQPVIIAGGGVGGALAAAEFAEALKIDYNYQGEVERLVLIADKYDWDWGIGKQVSSDDAGDGASNVKSAVDKLTARKIPVTFIASRKSAAQQSNSNWIKMDTEAAAYNYFFDNVNKPGAFDRRM